jgi:hypothetical protein
LLSVNVCMITEKNNVNVSIFLVCHVLYVKELETCPHTIIDSLTDCISICIRIVPTFGI